MNWNGRKWCVEFLRDCLSKLAGNASRMEQGKITMSGLIVVSARKLFKVYVTWRVARVWARIAMSSFSC